MPKNIVESHVSGRSYFKMNEKLISADLPINIFRRMRNDFINSGLKNQ